MTDHRPTLTIAAQMIASMDAQSLDAMIIDLCRFIDQERNKNELTDPLRLRTLHALKVQANNRLMALDDIAGNR